MNKCLVIFVEGDTEFVFYKRIVAYARGKLGDTVFDTHIVYRNVGGVGGFKNIAKRKFEKEIRPKYDEKCQFTIVLCSDTDVFEFSSRPPVDWKAVERDLRKSGASRVVHVRAKHSIEDWFLLDWDGVISSLHLKKGTKVSGKNGYEKLTQLYKMANKIYYKGAKSTDMVDKLDIDKISMAVKDQLRPLYKCLGVRI